MSWVAVAIGGSAVLGLGGSMMSANSASKSAANAADANRQNTLDTNALNERLFNQGHGAPGSDGYGHAILPQYFGGNEQALGQSAYDLFNRLSGSGNTAYGQSMTMQNNLNPALNSSLTALGNRYNGADLQQRLGYANPYFAARTTAAQNQGLGYQSIARANQGAIGVGLQQAFAQMNAGRAQQGYFGTSLYDRNRIAQSTIGAQQQGAIGMAQANMQARGLTDQANFQNQQDIYGLHAADMDFRANPSALTAGLSSATNYFGAPAQALANSYSTAMTPLNYFRIAPQSFQAQNLPTVSPEISNGQILGSALGQAGTTSANYFLNRSLINSLPQGYGNGANPYAGGNAMYSPSVLGQGNYLSGASPFTNPYAPAASSAPSFGYQMPPQNYGAIPPIG